jgi:hypothetical protein
MGLKERLGLIYKKPYHFQVWHSLGQMLEGYCLIMPIYDLLDEGKLIDKKAEDGMQHYTICKQRLGK